MDLTEAEYINKRCHEHTEELYKKFLVTLITTMMWSLTQNQTAWIVNSSGPQDAFLWTKLVKVMEFHPKMMELTS